MIGWSAAGGSNMIMTRDLRGSGSTLKGDLFLLAMVSGFEVPTNTNERAHPHAAISPPPPSPPPDCATHARPLHPAALAFVSYGKVLVRVRVLPTPGLAKTYLPGRK
jgi:hypothetical protein